MKNNPTRSERREEKRLRRMNSMITISDFQLIKSTKHKEFILKSYLNITIIPLFFSVLIYTTPFLLQSFDIQTTIFEKYLIGIISMILCASLSTTLIFTGALYFVGAAEDLSIDQYKSYVRLTTVIMLAIFWAFVAYQGLLSF